MHNYTFFNLKLNNNDNTYHRENYRREYYGIEEDGIMRDLITGIVIKEATYDQVPPVPGLSYYEKRRGTMEELHTILIKYRANFDMVKDYVSSLIEVEKNSINIYNKYLKDLTVIDSIVNSTIDLVNNRRLGRK